VAGCAAGILSVTSSAERYLIETGIRDDDELRLGRIAGNRRLTTLCRRAGIIADGRLAERDIIDTVLLRNVIMSYMSEIKAGNCRYEADWRNTA